MRIDKRENAKWTVYIHISPSGKYYVGITSQKDARKRWRNGNGYIKNDHFYRAIQKYGWDNFEHQIIASNITKDEACKFEIALIRELKSNDYNYGYNMSSGGEGGMSGIYGEKNPNYGNKCTDKTKKLISERLKGKMLGSKNPNAKPIVCLNTGKLYGSSKEAYDDTKVDRTSITMCCNKKIFSAGVDKDGNKLVWVFKQDYDKMPQDEISEMLNVEMQYHRASVYVVNLDTNEVFSQVKLAAHKYNITSRSNIAAACNGRYKTCGGYHWQYYTDYLKLNNLTSEEAQQRLFFVA